MSEVGRITAVLDLEDGSFKSKLRAAEGDARGFGSSLSKPIAIGISTAGAMAAIQGLISLAGQLSDALGPGVAMSWEKGLGGVLKTVNTDNVGKLNDELLDLRATMRDVSASDIQTGAGILGSMDIGGDEIKGATQVLLQAKAAFGDLSLDDTARQLGLITGLWSEQTQAVGGNVEMMRKASSSVNELGNQKRATEKNLLAWLSEFGGTAGTYNIDVGEATALGGLLESKGIMANEANTWVRSALMEGLLSPTVETSKDTRGYKLAAQMLGMDDTSMKAKLSTDFSKTLIDIISAVETQYAGDSKAAERTQIYQKLLGSYGSQLNKLAGTQGEFAEYLAIANQGFDEGTSLQKEYAKQTDNLDSALSELNGSLDVARIRAWEGALGPAKDYVQGLAQAVRDATPKIQEYAGDLWSGDPEKQKAAITGISDAVMEQIQNLGPLASDALANWDWSVVGDVIGTAIGDAIGLVLGGAEWLYENSPEILGAAIEIGQGIADGIYGALTKSESFQTFLTTGVTAFNALGSAVYTVANAISTALVGAINIAIQEFANLVAVADRATGFAISKTMGFDVGASAPVAAATASSPRISNPAAATYPGWVKYPNAKYYNPSTGQTRTGVMLPSDASAAQWMVLSETIPAASGGFFTDRPVLMGEAGREAYVPISNRSAGLAMLPQLMRELGVQTMADGGFWGAVDWLLKPVDTDAALQPGAKWDEQKALDNLNSAPMRIATNLAAGGTPGVRAVMEESVEEIKKIPEEQRTSTQKGIVAGHEDTQHLESAVTSGFDALAEASTPSTDLTDSPAANWILGKQLTAPQQTWKDVPIPVLKGPDEKKAAAELPIEHVSEEVFDKWLGPEIKSSFTRAVTASAPAVAQTTAAAVITGIEEGTEEGYSYYSDMWAEDYRANFKITPPVSAFQSSAKRGMVPVGYDEEVLNFRNPWTDETVFESLGLDKDVAALQAKWAGNSLVKPSAGVLNDWAVDPSSYLPKAKAATEKYTEVTDAGLRNVLLMNDAIVKRTAEDGKYCEAMSEFGKKQEELDRLSDREIMFKKSYIGPTKYYEAAKAYYAGETYNIETTQKNTDAVASLSSQVEDNTTAIKTNTVAVDFSKEGLKNALLAYNYAALPGGAGGLGATGSTGGQPFAVSFAQGAKLESIDSWLGECYNLLSDQAIMMESGLAGDLFAKGYIGPKGGKGPNLFDTLDPRLPYYQEAQRRGLIGGGDQAQEQLAKIGEYQESTSDILDESNEHLAEIDGTLKDNQMQLKGALAAAGPGAVYVPGVGVVGGGGAGAYYMGAGGGLPAGFANRGGGMYFGGTSISGGGAWVGGGASASGWGAQAVGGSTGGFGGSQGWGSVAWAEGGLINSPELFMADGRLSIRGEAGPELILPLSNPSRTRELLARYLPDVRPFAAGGLVGGKAAAGKASGGNYTFNYSPVIQGSGLSEDQLSGLLEKERQNWMDEISQKLYNDQYS